MASGPKIAPLGGWELAALTRGVRVIAGGDGLRIVAPANDWSEGAGGGDRLGRLLPDLLPQMEGMGVCSRGSGGCLIGYRELVALPAQGIDAFDGLAAWAPWPLEIETDGSPGSEAFRCSYRFQSATGPVYPERLGCFLRLDGEVFRIDALTFRLVEAIEEFRSLPPEQRVGPAGLMRTAEIKRLALEGGAELDRFFRRERIVIPSQVGTRVIAEPEGRISLTPEVASVSTDALTRAVFASDTVPAVVSLADGDERVRIVLNENLREAVRRMQAVRHVGGAVKAEVLRNPAGVFDGVADVVEYGPRVTGVGDFPFKTELYYERYATGALEAPNVAAGVGAAQPRFGIRASYADGSVEHVPFRTRADARQFCQQVHDARRSGRDVVEWGGKTVLVDDQLEKSATELEQAVNVPRQPAPGKYLLIRRNDGSLEYQEDTGSAFALHAAELPAALRPDAVLKPHQLAGVAWLQQAYRAGRRGCLLADDMGLGKTLQVLTFLAWLIERGETALGPDSALPPWRPALVVAPLTLIELEVWRDDMRRFFRGGGAVFQPWLPLRGREIDALRLAEGAELQNGSPRLDWQKLERYRIVLTNYETVVRYQHSFAAMRDRWSAVVTDEAQRTKTPDTRVSHALKGLAPRFRIACTGTPVETTLLDLWNIMDYLQPGALLDSAREFARQYHLPPQASRGDAETAARRLQSRLRLGKPDAFLLRRDKRQLVGLVAKHEHVLTCVLSDRQREEHLSLLAAAAQGTVHPFALLQGLMKVSQHPALSGVYEPLDAEVLIDQCPKLRVVLDTLAKIQSREEKALIFTRALDMQQILHAALRHRFGIDAGVINGGHHRARREILSTFTNAPGFGVLILSPDVAGFGLNLVAANHVIHYGRWWNPAKESQATDRIYRLGQARDVHVYIPVASDPRKEFRTFDEKLDDLLRKRRAMAEDFLCPAPAEPEIEAELFRQVTSEPIGVPGDVGVITARDLSGIRWDRFEALISLLERKQGAETFLTPKSGDDKADVIAIVGTELRLIQCKHTSIGAAIEEDALREILSALDIYRLRYLKEVQDRFTLRPIVITNGIFSARARRLGRDRQIELGTEVQVTADLQRTPCTWAEIEMEESRRLASMSALREAIAAASPGVRSEAARP